MPTLFINQSALLKVAKAEPEQQVEVVREIVEAKATPKVTEPPAAPPVVEPAPATPAAPSADPLSDAIVAIDGLLRQAVATADADDLRRLFSELKRTIADHERAATESGKLAPPAKRAWAWDQGDIEDAITATTTARPDWHARAAAIAISSGEGKGKRITPEALALLREMDAAGENAAEIGRVLGLAGPSVRHHLKPATSERAAA